jgi:hypothetical protein
MRKYRVLRSAIPLSARPAPRRLVNPLSAFNPPTLKAGQDRLKLSDIAAPADAGGLTASSA